MNMHGLRHADAASANLAAPRRDDGLQGEFSENGGRAGWPGARTTDRLAEVARACAARRPTLSGCRVTAVHE
jgi:hypothetical protein